MMLVPGSGRNVLIDLVNAQNDLPHDLTSQDVFISPPKKVVFPGQLTRVEVSIVPLPTSKYEDAVKVQYQRQDLTSAFGEIRPRVEGPSSGTLTSILPAINEALGIQLTMEDFEEVDYSWLDVDEQANIQLVAKPSSISFTGSFVIQFTRKRWGLDIRVLVRELDVLLLPGMSSLNSGKQAVTTATYSTDFTEYRWWIRRHPLYNIPANSTDLRSIMSSLFGYENYPAGWDCDYFDLPTSSVPEANKDYDRVIIHRTTNPVTAAARPYEGVAYLHYNQI